jgi:hypothetical protein
MRIGMALPQYGSAFGSAVALVRFVTRIEQLGYDSSDTATTWMKSALPGAPGFRVGFI